MYVPIAESIRGFKEILEGKHDELPERAFFMKGTIDQVVEDAKKGLARRSAASTMAKTKFQVEVLTPEGEVFNDEVEMVSTRTTVGSIGVLANHAPLLAMLDPTELRLYVRVGGRSFRPGRGLHAGREQSRAAARRGGDRAGSTRLLRPARRLQTAERELESAGEDTERRRVAERDKRRLERFLQIAQGDAVRVRVARTAPWGPMLNLFLTNAG